ncbi:MAG: hydrolase [Candidatus Saccharibacteria bacterium]|nr:hydrolase [Candidatus Saccharibacteria bacterium]
MGVAKVLIIDEQNQYLMMWRSEHPHFPNEPDLPGGTIEASETPDVAAVREVEEEAGIKIALADIKLLYQGPQYSAHHTGYSLYVIKISPRPKVVISWEHAGYEWLSRDEFLKAAKNSTDTYMHMVYEVVSKNNF